MNYEMFYEILGYVASVIVAISLMMSSIVKLRIINFIGAVLFSIYGFLIGALPVGILNASIAMFNIYHLSKLTKKEDNFKIKTYNSIKNDILEVFFEFYSQDIVNFFPDFKKEISNINVNNQFSVIFFRNNIPAGILIGNKNNGQLDILVDYVIPEYRDFKLANYLFTDKKVILLNENINKVIATTTIDKHKKYLERLNFNEIRNNYFELAI